MSVASASICYGYEDKKSCDIVEASAKVLLFTLPEDATETISETAKAKKYLQSLEHEMKRFGQLTNQNFDMEIQCLWKVLCDIEDGFDGLLVFYQKLEEFGNSLEVDEKELKRWNKNIEILKELRMEI
ncbi:unnamed protein product [Bursaphelenchus okinawaensis]|uniref:Uncharacterized protein n=1 Tax=Bursaphelenchus okinawaensis TaxID=465554 RepID=A0A811KH32_9BILA|nr:unnamed protein product [Bursaphelenchus okinawaensis]CAG9103009.1 unnamed protein product [Bursaphelenchus okinawaensis]